MPEGRFTHFEPERVVIPTSERGGVPNDGVQIVVDSGGTVACVGSPSEVREWLAARRSEGAEIATERGGVLLPGLADSHFHPALFGMIELARPIDVSRADSLAALQRTVRSGIKGLGLRSDEPAVVLDYDSGRLGRFRDVNFDEIESAHPMLVIDRSFHGGAANSRGMALLKEYLAREYPDRVLPGRIRGNEFTETYVLAALEVAESFQTVEAVKEAIERNIEGCLARGVTAIHDLGASSWHQLMAYLLLKKEWESSGSKGEFPVKRLFLHERVLGRLSQEADDLAKSGLFTSDLPGMLGVKFFADGAFGSETALISDAYHTSHRHGTIVTRMEEVEKAFKNLLKLGANKLAVHAIGDAGIRRAFEFARRWRRAAEKGSTVPEVRFEHFELPLGGSVREAKDLGAWVSMQSNFAVEDTVYHDRLGDRVQLTCPHADLTNEGVPMMLGSDGMPPSMLYVIWSAMHHPNPKQRLDLISAVTAASATVASNEGGLRSVLKRGSKCDIVVANPTILDAFADGKPAEEYISEALKPRSERKDVPIRDQVGTLERTIAKVFRSGQVVG